MATRIAAYITNKMLASSVIEEDDRELYCYGFFLLSSGLFFFLVTLVAGFLVGTQCESIIFYIVFMLLRSYAGGVHAKTETACTILTTLVLTISVFEIKLMSITNSNVLSLLMLLIGCFPILLFSPLGSKDKPMTNQEKHRYRVISHAVVSLCLVLALTAKILAIDMLYYPITSGVFLEGILLGIGKLLSCKE